jgi:hypothetical protein
LNRVGLRNMKYLQSVLKESRSPNSFVVDGMSLKYAALRLYPAVPVNTRTTLRTTVLPTGPKGTSVAYSVYTMHRRPDLYGMDAELFRPERWDEDMPLNQNETNAKWGYLPFNGGPRICLGSECSSPLSMSLEILSMSSLQWISHSRKLRIHLCESFKDFR